MLKKIFLFVLCWPISLFSQSIIPLPVNITTSQGAFLIDAKTFLKFDKKNKELQDIAELFSASIKNISGISISNKGKGLPVSFNILAKEILGKEGYELNV